MRVSSVQNDTFWFLKGGGEMGKLIQHYSWRETQLQDPVAWPDVLKSALSQALNSKMPSMLFWGSDAICFYNDACLPIVGILGKHPSALGETGAEVWPETWGVVKPVIDSVLSDGESVWNEEGPFPNYFNKLLEDSPPTFCYAPVYGKDAKPSGVLVTCTEVAARRRSVANPENYENQFYDFIRKAPVGLVLLIGEEMRVEVVNEIFGHLIGRTPEELLHKKLFDVIPEAENDFRPVLDAARLAQKPFYRYAQQYSVRARGEKMEGFMDLVCQPYQPLSDGTVGGIMVLCHDVTEQVRNRTEAQAEEAKARLAIESAGLGTYEINLLTDEIKTSERFNAIWGLGRDLSRANLTSLIHPDDRAVIEAAHKDSIETGSLHYEVRIRCKDNHHRCVRVKGTVLYDADHKATVLIGVAQDITEQKDFASELRKLVDERTKQLQTLNEELAATNEELSETNMYLTRANKDLEEFAYVASHDLQEPLRKIQTFANIVEERFADGLSDAAAGYLRKVTASAHRMSGLIKDLLDYSRLNFNTLIFQPLDLNTIVKDVISDFEVLLTQKGTVVHIGKLPVIKGIPIQMNQLFYNLIGNAIKFSRKGVTPEITITSRTLDHKSVSQYPELKSGEPYHEISIADNGIGFSQQYAEQIFAIFQRLNDRATYGGYGIGLALCRKIIANHNGLVFAKGQENAGATFTVILPEDHA